jgi:uncharacterized protein
VSETTNVNLLVPIGTQVVVRHEVRVLKRVIPAGAVGRVVEAPVDATHSYTVRFPDGANTKLRRTEFAIRKQVQGIPMDGRAASDGADDLQRFVIYRCVVGSQAFGLARDGSDIDRRGIYLPSADLHWSLYGVPEQLESADGDDVYWELQKFLMLALKANPNVLECLSTPLIEFATPLARELLAMGHAFISKLVYQTYNGYVLSQFKRMEQDVRATGTVRWKHAMHLIRLLLSGICILQEGLVPLNVGHHRDRLLAIRDGQVSWNDVETWRQELHDRFDRAFESTSLPERPEYDRVNDFLLLARRSAL